MSHGFWRSARPALFFSLGTTACFAALPFVAASSASFLGKDVSTVAAGVVSFYPWSAVAEGARVLGVALALALAAGLTASAAARRFSGLARFALFPLAPLVAYLLWGVGAVVKYPALYEGVLPPRLLRGVWELAGVATPHAFFVAAAAMMLALLALAVLPARRGKVATLAPVAAAVAVAGFAGAFAGEGSSGQAASLPAEAHPNVLLIGVDSLRLDRLARPEVTPALQQLLADPQTVSFRDHHVGIPRTFPSWVEMLTGRYSARTGIRHMFPGFGERSSPFAGLGTALRDAGYQTAALSDFAGDIFPRFEAGFTDVEAPKLTLRTMIRLSVDQTLWTCLPFLTTGPLRPYFPSLKESPAFGDAEHLGEALRHRLASAPTDQPWFTTVFFSTAHFPYAAPHPYYRMFSHPGYQGSFRFDKNPDLSGDKTDMTPAEIAQVRALYDGAVRSIDDELARIFRDLKARGLWDRTLIVVTADHGEDLYENGMLQGHGEHLRGVNVLNVPLLVKLPTGLTPKVRQVTRTTRSIDLAATVLAAVGLDPKKGGGDGVDVLPLVFGQDSAVPPLAAYAETGLWFSRGGKGFFQAKRLDYPGISGVLSFDQGYSGEIVLNPVYNKIVVTAKHRMLIEGDRKLIYMPTPRGIEYELYDRRKDPANLHDLSAAEPARLAEMKAHLLAFVKAQEGPKASLLDDFVVPK